MKYKKISKSTLDATVTLKVINLFESKGWPINVDSENNRSPFNRFCLMLENLTSHEQNLLLELSQDYLKIDFTHYFYHLERVLEQALNADNNGNFSKLFFMALIAPEDRDKLRTKSAVSLAYFCKATNFHYSDILEDKEFLTIDDVSNHIDIINQSPDSVLILVDDFIGTGETAQHALEHLFQLISREKIIVISLVAQQEGISRIQALGIKVYSSVLRKKGITDTFLSEDASKRLQIMKDIEVKRKVKDKFRYGYGQSEALVTMGRTPNNTFPVFWYESKNQVVPFPRS